MGASVIGRRVGHELEQRASQREDIAAAIHWPPCHLFRRHIAERPREMSCGRRIPFENAGDAKIQHFDDAILVEHQVIGLDVEVDDAGPVSVSETRTGAFDELESCVPMEARPETG